MFSLLVIGSICVYSSHLVGSIIVNYTTTNTTPMPSVRKSTERGNNNGRLVW